VSLHASRSQTALVAKLIYARGLRFRVEPCPTGNRQSRSLCRFRHGFADPCAGGTTALFRTSGQNARWRSLRRTLPSRTKPSGRAQPICSSPPRGRPTATARSPVVAVR
jgi:hypothetical protein